MAEVTYASRGVAGTALGLGAGALALNLVNGNLANLFNQNGNNLQQENAELKAKNALLEANIYNDQKSLELYKYFDGEIKDIRSTICANDKAQAVINAKFESGIDVMASQVASINNTIANLTRTVIPNSSVCPGYGNVTVSTVGNSTCCGYNANV